jgi:N-acetylglucosaminyldiphosphoundecaprenol N-acetyl-beta-D-mannosaminyltransferase
MLACQGASAYPARYRILSIDFDLVDGGRAFEKVRGLIAKGQKTYVTLTNPNGVMNARKDAAFKEALADSSLVLPDGIGIILAARLFGYGRHQRVDGPTFMLRVCDEGRRYGFRHYFYGGAEGVADRLASTLTRQYPGLQAAGTFCPPFRCLTPEEDADVVTRINRAEPHIVWVGLGAPKQEKWMAEHCGHITAPVMIGVGAAFNYNSGYARRAPQWLRDCGLEWSWRFFENPRRDIGRKFLDLKFLAYVLGVSAAHRLGSRVPADA